MQRYIQIADITKSFGLKGEVSVRIHSEDIDNFLKYKTFFYSLKSEDYIELTYQNHKWSSNTLVIKFKEFNSVNDVEKLKNVKLYIRYEDLPKPEEGEYYIVDLIKCKAFFNDNDIGNIGNVTNYGSCDLFEIINNQNKRFYIPYLDDYVDYVDLEKNIVFFKGVEEFLP